MAIELHHLHPGHDNELLRLKARIAELERMDTEHTVQIAKMNCYIHHLEEERRLRKASEELPIDNDDVYVILENGFKTTDRYDHDKGHWHCHWYTVKYWMPLTSAPKDEK